MQRSFSPVAQDELLTQTRELVNQSRLLIEQSRRLVDSEHLDRTITPPRLPDMARTHDWRAA